jgi:homoserine kinase type II
VGVFTALGDAELAAIADDFGLGAVVSWRPIAAGTINSNFELVTTTARTFVRVNEGKAEVDVAWEARLVGALAASGVNTPPPLVARDSRPYARLPTSLGGVAKWVSAFSWRAGVHLAPGDVDATQAARLGAELAKLHVAGLALPEGWRRGSIYDHDHLVARHARIAQANIADLARAVDVLGDELAHSGAAAAVRRRATHGMIHGDLFRDNVLWDGDRVTALLDFEQASGGSLVYDLAVCINDWCWNGAPRIDVAAAMLVGYGEVRPLTVADRAALPIEIRAAATRFTITRITDVYLARVANPDKDFRAFLARVDAWRGPALGQLAAAL